MFVYLGVAMFNRSGSDAILLDNRRARVLMGISWRYLGFLYGRSI